MNYCQCQGIEEVFSQDYVNKELSRYRKGGPPKTTRLLVEAVKKLGVGGLSLLDIGGGVGSVQYALLAAGVEHATSVEASAAYLTAAQAEAKRRGVRDRVSYQYGNFVDLASGIAPADIVTLDRVICCYPDMEKLVSLSAASARKIYALVYPRDTWWIKAGLGFQNFFFRLRKSSYRGFVHSTRQVEAILHDLGLKQRSYQQTLVWQVVVYTR